MECGYHKDNDTKHDETKDFWARSVPPLRFFALICHEHGDEKSESEDNMKLGAHSMERRKNGFDLVLLKYSDMLGGVFERMFFFPAARVRVHVYHFVGMMRSVSVLKDEEGAKMGQLEGYWKCLSQARISDSDTGTSRVDIASSER